MLDKETNVMHLIRSDKLATYSEHNSPILQDVSTHNISERQAEEQLEIFRKHFLTFFPLVYIPKDKKAAELRTEKPFLWLVIMSLTNRNVAEQFAMEETVWKVISQRIVVQHHVSLDLMQGIVAFAAW